MNGMISMKMHVAVKAIRQHASFTMVSSSCSAASRSSCAATMAGSSSCKFSSICSSRACGTSSYSSHRITRGLLMLLV